MIKKIIYSSDLNAAAYFNTPEYCQQLPEKLLPASIAKKIPALGSTDEIPTDRKKVIVKFFSPDSYWRWFVFEGEQREDGDWLFFGLVDGIEAEPGYFTLSELCKLRDPWGWPVKREKFCSEARRQNDIIRLDLNSIDNGDKNHE